MDYPEILDCRHVAQSMNNLLFPCEQEGSAENPKTIEKDEGFPKPRAPVSEPPSEQSAMLARPASSSVKN